MKNILKYASVLALGWLTSGCNSFLDEQPDNRTEIDTEDKLTALLVTAYPNRLYAPVLEGRVDYYTDEGVTFRGSQQSANFDYVLSAFMWDQYTRSEAGNDSYEQFWTSTYSAVAAANQALASIEEMGDPASVSQQKGEALVCRAYNHFTLLTMYSNFFDAAKRGSNPGVPYVEEPENVVIKQYERGTVQSTFDKVLRDFNEGIGKLGGSADYAQPKFHFTRDAGHALGARIALYSENYGDVIGHATAIGIPVASRLTDMTSGGSPLVNKDGSKAQFVADNDPLRTYCKLNMHDWNSLAQNPGGVDGISMEFSGADAKANLLVMECVTSWPRVACNGTYFSRYGIEKETLSEMRTNTASGVTQMLPIYSYSSDPAGIVPKFYEDFKYTNIAAGTGIIYTKFPIFRIEEVLLARAEAFAMTGRYQDALNDLNMWTKVRATSETFNDNTNTIYRDALLSYYSRELEDPEHFVNSSFNQSKWPAAEGDLAFQKALILAILDARTFEFINEGLRYFDILRWNIPVTHVAYNKTRSTLTPDDDRRVIQIPQVASLSGLEPNPWVNVGTWE